MDVAQDGETKLTSLERVLSLFQKAKVDEERFSALLFLTQVLNTF